MKNIIVLIKNVQDVSVRVSVCVSVPNWRSFGAVAGFRLSLAPLLCLTSFNHTDQLYVVLQYYGFSITGYSWPNDLYTANIVKLKLTTYTDLFLNIKYASHKYWLIPKQIFMLSLFYLQTIIIKCTVSLHVFYSSLFYHNPNTVKQPWERKC